MTDFHEHILVVDDDEAVLRLIEDALKKAGCRVSTATSGVSALGILVQENVDVMVTDITMPEMNGMELIRSARQFKIDIPILILSSNNNFAMVMEGIKLGALDYITKDTKTAEHVVHAVAKALRYTKMVASNSELNNTLKERNRELEELDRHNRRLLERFMLLNEELSGKMDEADLELSRRLSEITALNEVTHAIGSVLELEQVLQMTMHKSREVMNAEASSLMLVDEENPGELVVYVTTGQYGQALTHGRLKVGEGIAGWVAQHGQPLIVDDAYLDERFSKAYDQQTGFRTRSVLCEPLQINGSVIGVAQVLNAKLKPHFDVSDLTTFSGFCRQASLAIHNARLLAKAHKVSDELRSALERERWLTTQRDKLGMYVPKSALEKISTEREDILASPTQLVEATVLFSDIKGFTSLLEKTPPHNVVEALNHYHSHMHTIIEKHHGVLDKFMGDGIMTIFLPGEGWDAHELRAVRCGVEMMEALKHVTPKWEELGVGKAIVRVGVQSGEMVSGSIGAKRRRDYTVLGDPVNVASRLEGLAPDNQVLIGEATYQKVAGLIEVKELVPVKVKNRAEPVKSYLVLSATPAEPSQ